MPTRRRGTQADIDRIRAEIEIKPGFDPNWSKALSPAPQGLSSHERATVDLTAELQRIYDSEINVEIGWMWDGGIDVRLGGKLNGYLAEENVKSVADIVTWLQEAIAHFHPESEYERALDAEIRERAARRVFLPPRIGARAICPHCEAPYAFPALDELIAFTCPRCGNFVKVEPSKVQ